MSGKDSSMNGMRDQSITTHDSFHNLGSSCWSFRNPDLLNRERNENRWTNKGIVIACEMLLEIHIDI
jgi:hypothetical protein